MRSPTRIGVCFLFVSLGSQAVVRPGLGAEPTNPPAGSAAKQAGGASLEKLSKDIKDKDPEVRQHAIKGLARLGVEATPFLIGALKDDDRTVRRDAAYGLKIQRVDPTAVLPVLKPYLKDEDPIVRQAVAGALGKCGTEALPLVIEALKDKEAGVRQQAAQGLQAILRKDQKAVSSVLPAAAQALQDESAGVRLAAVQTLAHCGPEGVPHLLKALKDPNIKIRGLAIGALGNAKVEPAEVLPPLVAQFKEDDNVAVRQAILRTLAKLGPDAVPALMEALKDKEDSIQAVALKSLGQIGPKAGQAVPAVKDMALKASNPAVRSEAVATLGKLGPDGIPPLLELLKGADSATRLDVLPSLAHAKDLPKTAVPLLIEALGDKEVKVRALAAHILGELGPEAKEAVPALTKLLDDPDKDLRPYVEKALDKIKQ